MRKSRQPLPRRWIETVCEGAYDERWVNVDHIAELKWVGEKRLYQLIAPDGRVYGFCKEADISFDLNAIVLPAYNESVTAVQVSGEETWVGQLQVAGWSISDEMVSPIIPGDDMAGDVRIYLNLPEGHFGDGYGDVYGTLDEVIAAAKEEIKETNEAMAQYLADKGDKQES
jgi:hypothetical protein